MFKLGRAIVLSVWNPNSLLHTVMMTVSGCAFLSDHTRLYDLSGFWTIRLWVPLDNMVWFFCHTTYPDLRKFYTKFECFSVVKGKAFFENYYNLGFLCSSTGYMFLVSGKTVCTCTANWFAFFSGLWRTQDVCLPNVFSLWVEFKSNPNRISVDFNKNAPCGHWFIGWHPNNQKEGFFNPVTQGSAPSASSDV